MSMSRTLYTLCGADSARPFSPHCWKTVMSLRHKGLDFVEAPLPFTEIAKVENGATRIVPLLRDGERLVADSFAIALYLEEAYPERPSLFRGDGGKAMARFVEGYSQLVLHTAITRIALLDIHDMLAPVDQAYFAPTARTALASRWRRWRRIAPPKLRLSRQSSSRSGIY
jgi:glutathione S-transferase